MSYDYELDESFDVADIQDSLLITLMSYDYELDESFDISDIQDSLPVVNMKLEEVSESNIFTNEEYIVDKPFDKNEIRSNIQIKIDCFIENNKRQRDSYNSDSDKQVSIKF